MKKGTNNKGQETLQFSATLKSISGDDNIQKNVNDTEYRIAGIKFKDTHGKFQEVTGIMYEANYQLALKDGGLEIGESYLTTATKTDQGVFLQVSHLKSITNRAEENMFDFESVNVEEKVKDNVETKKS